MKLARPAALASAFLALAGAGVFACASKDRKAPGTPLDEDAPAAVVEPAPAKAAAPSPPPPPRDPFEGISGDPTVGFEGAEALLREAIAPDLELPAFDLACFRAEGALETPGLVDSGLEQLAREQAVALGRVRLIRIESDPSRGEVHARLCRPVREDALLHAPLFREKEPAARWLVEPQADVAAAVKALLSRAAEERVKPAAPPRAVVVRGRVVAVALPVTGASG